MFSVSAIVSAAGLFLFYRWAHESENRIERHFGLSVEVRISTYIYSSRSHKVRKNLSVCNSVRSSRDIQLCHVRTPFSDAQVSHTSDSILLTYFSTMNKSGVFSVEKSVGNLNQQKLVDCYIYKFHLSVNS